jgi:molybdopterin-guanine dinucleotide biosynthesis protein A
MGMHELSLLILAGGKSSRMGLDKAWLVRDGRPLVVRLVDRLHPLVAEVIVSTNRPRDFDAWLPALPLPSRTVADRHPDVGPLAGLHAGLTSAACDLVVTLATDMPFVSPALIGYLAGLAPGVDAVVPQLPDGETGELEFEPLHAIYRKSCLPAIERCLAAGQRRVVSFYPQVRLRAVPPEEIRRHDPFLRSFINVNTPQEWLAAQQDS